MLSRSVRIEPGGKGANQAAAAALDGAHVAFAGAVGHDPAAATALAGLVAAGVDVSRVAHTGEHTGMASVLVDRTGQNQIAVGSGANLRARADQVADADLGPGTTLVLQMEVGPAQTAALMQRAARNGARVILNLAPAAPLPDGVNPDWLVVNEAEASWLGDHLRTGASTAELYEGLGVDVVRTCGPRGVDATWGGRLHHLAACPVAAADTTGAGDCFVGVFAAALDQGASPGEALRRANVAAALSCTREGSQRSLPTRAKIDAALAGSPEPGLPVTRD